MAIDDDFYERVVTYLKQNELSKERLQEMVEKLDDPRQQRFARSLIHFALPSGLERFKEIIRHPDRMADFGEQAEQLEKSIKANPKLAQARVRFKFTYDEADQWKVTFWRMKIVLDEGAEQHDPDKGVDAIESETLHHVVGENLPTAINAAKAALPHVETLV